MNYKFFSALIGLILTTVLCSHAQTPPVLRAPGSPPPLLFRTLGVGMNAPDLFYIQASGLKTCTVDTQRRSPYYEFSAAGVPLVFVRVVTGADGKEQRVPVAQVTVDATLRRVLLIFNAGNSPVDPVQITVLKDDISAVPPGGFRVINYLPVPAGLTVGTEKLMLQPNAADTILPKLAPGRSVYEFKVFGILEGAAVPLFGTVYGLDTSMRHLVLLFLSSRSPNKMEVKFLSESVQVIRPDEEVPVLPQAGG